MVIGIIIGILMSSLVWCIILLKQNEDWGNECLKQILEVNDDWFEKCKETNEEWKKFCDYLIDKYCPREEVNKMTNYEREKILGALHYKDKNGKERE